MKLIYFSNVPGRYPLSLMYSDVTVQYFTVQYTALYSVHSTVQCTLHCTVYTALHCTVNCVQSIEDIWAKGRLSQLPQGILQ